MPAHVGMVHKHQPAKEGSLINYHTLVLCPLWHRASMHRHRNIMQSNFSGKTRTVPNACNTTQIAYVTCPNIYSCVCNTLNAQNAMLSSCFFVFVCVLSCCLVFSSSFFCSILKRCLGDREIQEPQSRMVRVLPEVPLLWSLQSYGREGTK